MIIGTTVSLGKVEILRNFEPWGGSFYTQTLLSRKEHSADSPRGPLPILHVVLQDPTSCSQKGHVLRVTRKQTLRSLSLSYLLLV